jgi:hypothetical protein
LVLYHLWSKKAEQKTKEAQAMLQASSFSIKHKNQLLAPNARSWIPARANAS